MKKYIFVALTVLPMIVVSGTALSRSKGIRDLVGENAKWTKSLVNSKPFANKTVLVEVMDSRKSTKVADLLDTVQSVLSEAQQSIFVDPIILAEHQNAGHVTVGVSGAVLSEVELSAQPPSEQRGVADLVISFKGDTTLPNQVLANLK